jgi:hypothetical protein
VPGRRCRYAAAAVSAVLALACTDAGTPTATPATTPAAGTTSSGSPACPAGYAEPDPKRPVLELEFALAPNHTVVTGVERLTFTPDRPIDDVVLRLWPNSPRESGAGRLVVTAASAGLGSTYAVERAGATPGHPGTLLRLRLPATSPAGTQVHLTVRFRLELPPEEIDRYGHTTTTAWWASGFPLLAWERGHGWTTEPASAFPSETATSEVMRLALLQVTAPARDEVLATGMRAGEPTTGARGTRVWRFTAGAVRDVAVAVGPMTRHAATIDGVPVEYASARGLVDLWRAVEPMVRRAIAGHVQRFGPFPYPTLTLVELPGIAGSGIEYPGVILLGDEANEVVVSHEIAHQWFYGLVGDDQARDPWLDEAFATYAQLLAAGEPDRYAGALQIPDRIGTPMAGWAGRSDAYRSTVYGKGSAALAAARSAAGGARFDAAIRCYVARNAHRIARPADLRAALSSVPAAVAELERAGAL